MPLGSNAGVLEDGIGTHDGGVEDGEVPLGAKVSPGGLSQYPCGGWPGSRNAVWSRLTRC